MISCTEFIPLYSEFFKYCESRGGHDEVLRYWIHLSDTSIGDHENPNSLAYKCDRLGGYEGAIAYWGHTLTEEACDVFQIQDEVKRYRYSHMRYCPSRGMLNSLTHVEPYYDYCSHCNIIYSRVLDKYGIEFVRDNSEVDKAQCRSLFYEKGNPPEFDWHSITDEEALATLTGDGVSVVDMHAEDNKYLHRDFHLIGDNAIAYCAERWGAEAARDFVATFARNYYAPVIERVKAEGLPALAEWIEGVYEVEEASDLLHTSLSGDTLTVTVDHSPAIAYMHTLGKEPSDYYIEETRTVYATVAEESGLHFTLDYYREDGAARFTFSR